MTLPSAKKLLMVGGRFERSGPWLFDLNGWVNKVNPVSYRSDGLQLIDNSFLQYDIPPDKFQGRQARLELDARVVLASNTGFITWQFIVGGTENDSAGTIFGNISLTDPSQEVFARYGFTTPSLSGARIRLQINHAGSDTRVRNWSIRRL